jgi:isopenicillin N synthase-like dioxygenase
LTINTGDLLARWRGDRWKSNRHRVLSPQADAADEDVVSVVFFYEADWDPPPPTTMGPRPATPIGKPNSYPPMMASEFLRRLPDAITVG